MTKLITLSLLLATTTAVQAEESLEERKYWKQQQSNVDATAKNAGKACGTEFTVEFLDKPKFREEATKTKHVPYSICQSMVTQVLMLCREGEDEKASVKAKIKTFQCGFAPERTLDIKDGTLIYLGNHKQPNFGAWAKPALTKKL